MFVSQYPPTTYKLSFRGDVCAAAGEYDPETGEPLYHVSVEIRRHGSGDFEPDDIRTRVFSEYPALPEEEARKLVGITTEWYAGAVSRMIKRTSKALHMQIARP